MRTVRRPTAIPRRARTRWRHSERTSDANGRTPALAAWVLLNQYSAAGMTVRGGSTILGPSHRPVAGAGGRSVVGMDRVRRELRGSVIALAMVAVTTVVVYALTQSLEVRRGSAVYLLPVLLAGWHLGLIPALVAAVAGVLWSGYFFFSPYYSFYLSRPNEILNLLLFMVVAGGTSHLANSMKIQTEIAKKREKEMGDLYAFSRRVAGAASAPDI